MYTVYSLSIHHPSLITHHSSLITHHSSLITHHSSSPFLLIAAGSAATKTEEAAKSKSHRADSTPVGQPVIVTVQHKNLVVELNAVITFSDSQTPNLQVYRGKQQDAIKLLIPPAIRKSVRYVEGEYRIFKGGSTNGKEQLHFHADNGFFAYSIALDEGRAVNE
jgi:hypothetical protein